MGSTACEGSNDSLPHSRVGAMPDETVTTFRVEVDGETVWSGEGDSYKVIPAEYRDRPVDRESDSDPHPPAHFLYATAVDGEEVLVGVQVSLAEEEGR